jgi:hypothetical protein
MPSQCAISACTKRRRIAAGLAGACRAKQNGNTRPAQPIRIFAGAICGSGLHQHLSLTPDFRPMLIEIIQHPGLAHTRYCAAHRSPPNRESAHRAIAIFTRRSAMIFLPDSEPARENVKSNASEHGLNAPLQHSHHARMTHHKPIVCITPGAVHAQT